MSTNPNTPPYPHLEDYRKMLGVCCNQKLSIPKNPKTRYRPPSWTAPKPHAYTKVLKVENLDVTQKAMTSYYAFVAESLQSGLLTQPAPTLTDAMADCPL